MADLSGLAIDTYYKAAVAAGVAIAVGGIASGLVPVITLGAGGAIAGVGEWMHIRKIEFPVDQGFGRTAQYWQVRREPRPAAVVVLGVGLVLTAIGIISLAKLALFG